MIKTYPYCDDMQLSPHFNVQEFRCKCGKAHDILVAEELVDKLEILFSKLNCSKIILTSGHRCSMQDRSVGGSGTGQHVNGNAADICCYGQDGQPISSKIVCCTAQDIGFGGIANITKEYIYTHVDVRTSNIWYGDETVNNNTVTKDFYQYFGISKGENTEQEEKMMTMKGIDVSVHNGVIDWNKVKAAGIQFAILRAGYGKVASQKDRKFEENYKNAKAAGIPVGAYWYSYATTAEEAKQEAQVCLEILKGKQFEFPIYFDLEEQKAFSTGKANCSAMIRAFCGELENSGYWAGLYMSRSPFCDYTENDIRTRYALWLAEYGSKLNYSSSVGMWQSSSTGKISGISGNVDLNTAYVDYPTSVKKAGLNGYNSQKVVSPAPLPPTAQSTKPESVNVQIEVNGQKYSGKLNKS